MPDGFRLGTGFIEVNPDLDHFEDKLKAALQKDKTTVQIPVEPDARDFKSKLEQAISKSRGANVKVEVDPDAKDFKSKLEAALARSRTSNIRVGIDPDAKDFKSRLDAALAKSRSSSVNIGVKADTARFTTDVEAAVARASRKNVHISVDYDKSQLSSLGSDAGGLFSSGFDGAVKSGAGSAGSGGGGGGGFGGAGGFALGGGIAVAVTSALSLLPAAMTALGSLSGIALGGAITGMAIKQLETLEKKASQLESMKKLTTAQKAQLDSINSQIKALSEFNQVYDAFKAFKEDLQQTLFRSVKPLLGFFIQAMAQADAFLPRLGGILSNLFKAVGPQVMPMLQGIEGFISNFLPQMTALLRQANGPMTMFWQGFAQLGKFMGMFMTNLGPGLQSSMSVFVSLLATLGRLLADIGHTAAGIANQFGPSLIQMFSSLGTLLGTVIRWVAQIGGVLTPFVTTVSRGLNSLINALGPIVLPLLNALVQVVDRLLIVAVPFVVRLLNGLRPVVPIVVQLVNIFGRFASTLLDDVLRALAPLIPILSRIIVSLLTPMTKLIGGQLNAQLRIWGSLLIALSPTLVKLAMSLLNVVTGLMPLINLMVKLDLWITNVQVAFLRKIIPVLGMFIGWIANVITWIAKIIETLGQWITAGSHWRVVWNDLAQWFIKTWRKLVDEVHQDWADIVNFMNRAWSDVAAFAKRIWNDVTSWLVNTWNNIFNHVKAFMGNTENFFRGAWNNVWNDLRRIWSTASTWIVQTWNDIFNRARQFLGNVENAFKSIWNTIWQNLRNTLNTIKSDIGTAVDWVKTRITNAWNTISSLTRTIWNDIGSFIGAGINAGKHGLASAINWIIDKLNWLGDNYNKGLGWIPGIPKYHDIGHVQMAHGGVLPGYAPGKDTIPVMASPGEGWLVPEAVKGIGGVDTINAINRHYAGHRGAGGPGLPGHFANGGQVASYATTFAGHRYVWGGGANPQTGWDCSSFMNFLLGHFGYPDVSGGHPPYAQHGPVAADFGRYPHVTWNSGKLGDFAVEKSGGHVGMIIQDAHGNGPIRGFAAIGHAFGTNYQTFDPGSFFLTQAPWSPGGVFMPGAPGSGGGPSISPADQAKKAVFDRVMDSATRGYGGGSISGIFSAIASAISGAFHGVQGLAKDFASGYPFTSVVGGVTSPKMKSYGDGKYNAYNQQLAAQALASVGGNGVGAVGNFTSGVTSNGQAFAVLPGNLLKAAQFFASHGYSKAAGAGIAGNMAVESGGDPEQREFGHPGNGGLIGFTPLGKSGAQITGNVLADFNNQLGATLNYNNAIGSSAIRTLNSMPSARAAATYYETMFERPRSPGQSAAQREAWAMQTFSHMANGGRVRKGDIAVVGEEGEEVVEFDRPGYVHPTGTTTLGNKNVTVNFYGAQNLNQQQVHQVVFELGHALEVNG